MGSLAPRPVLSVSVKYPMGFISLVIRLKGWIGIELQDRKDINKEG